jgi:hypothetical protein
MASGGGGTVNSGNFLDHSFSKTKESFITPSLVLIENDQVDLSDMDNLIPIMLPPKQKFSYYGDSQLLKAAGFEGDTLP